MTGFRLRPGDGAPDEAAPDDHRIRMIGRTEFMGPADTRFATDGARGQALAEFAGRACYQSWDRPNPATADNADFLRHIIEVGHLSILEHSTVTFYLTGISRSVTHEILRHRHFSYSELSPRYLPEQGPRLIEPAAIAADPESHDRYMQAARLASRGQIELLELLLPTTSGRPDDTVARKQARQAAQSLLPGATETALVMTGNYRAWRHFIGMRATDSADAEIRGLAVGILDVLHREAPAVFGDFRISVLADGTRTAASPLVREG